MVRVLSWRRFAASILAATTLAAEDWPEWRGRDRRGVWNETGIVESLSAAHLLPTWRTAIGAGYSGPAVAEGRVFVTDYAEGKERAVCLDERTGRVVWTREWPVNYRGLEYASGPRATPTVDQDRVYVLGAMGHLACLRFSDGSVVWDKEFTRDFQAAIPAWGATSAPLVVGERLIAIVGGRPNAKVIAFDKRTGRELWRALSSEDSEPGYSQPIRADAGGRQQIIVWHATGVSAIDPATGETISHHPFRVQMNTPIATPAVSGPLVLVSAFFDGARLLRLGSGSSQLLWRGHSTGETNTDTLNALLNSPVIDGDYIYGICNYGQLRCLRLTTGERVWESQQVTVERARNVSAYIIRQRDRYVFFNDRGELIFGSLSPSGYTENSRTALLRPTSKAGSRRQLGAVAWAHPAFANRAVFARNDEEIIRVSLSAP